MNNELHENLSQSHKEKRGKPFMYLSLIFQDERKDRSKNVAKLYFNKSLSLRSTSLSYSVDYSVHWNRDLEAKNNCKTVTRNIIYLKRIIYEK